MAILKNTTISGTGGFQIPRGNTANREEVTYTIDAFTTVGTTSWTAPAGVTEIEVLVVAGGGSGGSDNGGGGGAGGLIYNPEYSVTPGNSYTVTVGAGGVNTTAGNAVGTSGSNSVFDALTAVGGGRGGAGDSTAGLQPENGGSGGGSGGEAPKTPGSGTAGQGFAGGSSALNSAEAGGGGGGAGSIGGIGSAFNGGGGGRGQYFEQFSDYGDPAGWFAGGGGGGGGGVSIKGGRGGYGGGGWGDDGANPKAGNGTANTGGGGGGSGQGGSSGAYGGSSSPGGDGGSGIVLIRYALNSSSTTPKGDIRYNSDLMDFEAFESPLKGYTSRDISRNYGGHNLIENSDRVGLNWSKMESTDTVSYDNAVAPDGTTTATLFTGDGATSSRHTLTKTLGTRHAGNKYYTFSVYLKPRGSTRYVVLETASYGTWSNPDRAILDLSGDGAVIAQATLTAATIEPADEGFYRCSVTAKTNAGGGSSGWYINYTNNVSGTISSITLPSADGYWIWGAQVVEGLTQGIYNPTKTTWSPVPAEINGYRIHNFTNTGATYFVPSVSGEIEVLVVAGGGGGGGDQAGGGGGGGGVVYESAYPVIANTAYRVEVGKGGVGDSRRGSSNPTQFNAANGDNSVFGKITALGGGGGASMVVGGSHIGDGRSGGSGGGGSNWQGSGGFGRGGAGTNRQGHKGGYAYMNGGNGHIGGGGGGAGGAGQDARSPAAAGAGGPGQVFSILGTPYYFAGGGGGGCYYVPAAAGGIGGGGGGTSNTASGAQGGGLSINRGGNGGTGTVGGNGGANTGGGGGGSGGPTNNVAGNGGTGGSGIVVVRYRYL